MTEKIGQGIVDFGISANAENAKHFLFTNQNNGYNLPKQKINSDEGLQLKRMSTATAESMKLKVQNMKGTNLQRQNILFPAVWTPKKVIQYKYACHHLLLALTFKRTACVFFVSIFYSCWDMFYEVTKVASY